MQPEPFFRFTPKQVELWEAVASGNYNVLFFGGAIRGGKTIGSLACVVLLARIYPGSRWAVVRDTIANLERTTAPTIPKVIPSSFIKVRASVANQHTYTLVNGSQIILFAENYDQDKDLDRWKGFEVNGFVLEQAEELQFKSFQKAIERAGSYIIPNTDKQPAPVTICTFNPVGGGNWLRANVYTRHELRNHPEQLLAQGLEPWPSKWHYLTAYVTDNPHLPDSYRESLKANLDPQEFARFVLGDWNAGTAERPYAYQFRPHQHISAEIEYQPNDPVYVSFDFNVDPGCAAVFQHSFGEYIHQIDEVRLSNTDVYKMCEVLKERYPNAYMLVTGDASGRNRNALTRGAVNAYEIIRRELALPRASIQVPMKNPDLFQSRIMLNRMLETFPVYRIHPRCKHTINDLQYVEADEQGKPNKRDGNLTHLLDAVRYYLHQFHSNWLRTPR